MPTLAENVLEYLWTLPPPSFKRRIDGDFRKLLTIVSGQLADVIDALFAARRMWFVQTCPDALLDTLGAVRRMPRFPGESHDVYRARLVKAWEIWSKAGTKDGMEVLLTAVGFPNAEATELHTLGLFAELGTGIALGEFYLGQNQHAYQFDIDIPQDLDGPGLSAAELALLRRVVRKWKRAASMQRWFNLALDLGEEDTAPAPTDETMTVTIETFNRLGDVGLALGGFDLGPITTTTEDI